MPSLEFGLVGYGAWGSCHAQAIRETPGCALRAISAQTVESRARAARETGVEVVADFRTLIERHDIAVLDIVVPNFLHAELATLALEGGKHVLLEKPMAITVEDCDAIIAAWRRSGKLLLVGHEMRFSPLHRRMWEIVQDGSVGELRYLLMDLWRRPYRPGAGGWRLNPARVGNWTLEEPVHFFEATSWLLGPEAVPIAVYASGASNGSARDLRPSMVDHFTATVRYNSGAYAVISQTLGAVEHHLSIKLLGSRAMLRAEWHAELDRSQHPNYALEISDQGHLKSIPLDGTPGEYFELREEIASFVRAIRSGGDLLVTPEEARQAVALCLAAQRSLQTGTVIDVARNVR